MFDGKPFNLHGWHTKMKLQTTRMTNTLLDIVFNFEFIYVF